jgi:hypothetical protein
MSPSASRGRTARRCSALAAEAVLALAALLWLVETTAVCESRGGITPPQGRVESPGIVVVYRTTPPVIELGQHFTIEALICADDPAAVLTRVDAEMPEHRHGMNYRPTLKSQGAGRYLAEGFLFHMPGRWQLVFDVERAGRRTRLTGDILLE